MTKEVIQVRGMSCKHCVKAVTEAAEGIAGVKKVKVDLKAGTATVTFDGDLLADIKTAITEAGYDVA